MKKYLVHAAAVVSIALAGFATTASAEAPITINAGAGYWFFDREVRGLEPDDTWTPWVGAEWAFNDNWAAEVMFADDDTEYNDGTDVDVTTWQVGMKYYGGSYIGNAFRLRPYLAFGAGEIDLDADQFDTVETTINGGVGVRWMISRRVGLSLEGRALYSLDESETDLLTTAGLNFYLGKVDPDPEPVEVLDSDGDG
ncbi:MAG: outer membrane beta-barrel protein, partial [Pseudomonadota bacterium]